MSENVQTNQYDPIILGLYGVFVLYHGLNKGRVCRPRHQRNSNSIRSDISKLTYASASAAVCLIYIHSQSLLQGSATMMLDTATVIFDGVLGCQTKLPKNPKVRINLCIILNSHLM
jgi:hypothetical protein